jgi:hypothetical protein
MSQIEELKKTVEVLGRRVDLLEDVNAIRKLHYAYGYYIDFCRYDEVVQLFSKTGEMIFLSGIYRGHDSIARVFKTWFQNLFTQGKPGPVDGFVLDHFQMQDIITVANNRKTAKGRFRALLLGGSHESRAYKPQEPPEEFSEAGLYENEYVRESGVWKIKKLDYVVQWQATYGKGLAHTKAHLVPATKTYPENPLGPDEILPVVRKAWPGRSDMPMHYAHPVMGKAFAAKSAG